jgi:hypothetical protein
MTWDDYQRETGRNRRRAELERTHGRPVRAPAGVVIQALADLGRQDVDPAQVAGYVYRDQAAADAWQASTFEHNRVPSLGTVPADGGVLGIYDLRLG